MAPSDIFFSTINEILGGDTLHGFTRTWTRGWPAVTLRGSGSRFSLCCVLAVPPDSSLVTGRGTTIPNSCVLYLAEE